MSKNWDEMSEGERQSECEVVTKPPKEECQHPNTTRIRCRGPNGIETVYQCMDCFHTTEPTFTPYD